MITTLLVFVAMIGAMMAIVYVLLYLIFTIGVSLMSKFINWLLKRD
ncbi:MAG: hypothetical protein K6G75_08225 [Lachnospiraceae bacterium]|nr:hypothetical protein [Lachnospiraceae bacterium]